MLRFIEHRCFIACYGQDKDVFLQSLISNNIALLQSQKSIYATILTPQGKFLFDFFVIKEQDHFLIDVDKNSMMALGSLLRRYKLTAQILLKPSQPYYFYYSEQLIDGAICYQDTRHALLGYRVASVEALENAQPLDDWDNNILIENALPFRAITNQRTTLIDYNFHHCHAVDFHKGCYVGQEITARMYYKNLAKYSLISTYQPDKKQDINFSKTNLYNENHQQCGIYMAHSDQHILYKIYKKNIVDNQAYYIMHENDHTQIPVRIRKYYQ